MPTDKKVNWWSAPSNGEHELAFHVEWGCCCDMNVAYPRDKLAHYAHVIPEAQWNSIMEELTCCACVTCPLNTFLPIVGCCCNHCICYPCFSSYLNSKYFGSRKVISAPKWENPDAWNFDLGAAAGKLIYDQHGNRESDGRVGSGELYIHEARYGWANDIWGPTNCSHGAGCKDVTDIVRRDIKHNELHLNAERRGQFFNQHFWPETASGPPIPRKVAIRYSYGKYDGDIFEANTMAVPNETVCVHITHASSTPRSMVLRDPSLISKYRPEQEKTYSVAFAHQDLPPEPGAASHSSVTSELRELTQMRKEGLLSEEEFAAAKAQVLGLSSNSDPLAHASAPPAYSDEGRYTGTNTIT